MLIKPWFMPMLCLLTVSGMVFGEVDQDYRLVGIVDVGNGNNTAIVEFGDGKYRSLHKGDRLAGNPILEITKQRVLLELPKGRQAHH